MDQVGERVHVQADVIVVAQQLVEVVLGPPPCLDHRGLAQAEGVDALDRDLGDDADRSDTAHGGAEQLVFWTDLVHGTVAVDEAERQHVVTEVGRSSTGAVHVRRHDPGDALGIMRGQRADRQTLSAQPPRQVTQTSATPRHHLLGVPVDANDAGQVVERHGGAGRGQCIVERVPGTDDP